MTTRTLTAAGPDRAEAGRRRNDAHASARRPKGAPMLQDYRRRRAARRLKPGDGRPLQPFRWWQLLAERSLLTLRLVGRDGRDMNYAVDVRSYGKQGSLEGRAHLFVDGRHQAESALPAVFPALLPGGPAGAPPRAGPGRRARRPFSAGRRDFVNRSR